MSGIVPFSFEGAAIRIINQEGEPWFVLADICRVLEIENSRRASDRLDEDELGVHTVNTKAGLRAATTVNESGLYSLVLTSRKPSAKRFKRWVTSEVLPEIRKTGAYGTVDPMRILTDPATVRSLLLNYVERVLTLQVEISRLTPKEEALNRLATSAGSMCITDAAKTLQIPPSLLFRFLRTKHWIYTRIGGSSEIGYQARITAGLLEHKTHTVNRSDGSEKTVAQVRITPKGLTVLAKALNASENRPLREI